MRPRLSRPRSLRARTALAAGLVALVLFAAGAWEMRHVAYDQQMREAQSDARQQADLILSNTSTASSPTGDQWGKYPYEEVTSVGLLGSSSGLKAFETHGQAFMPKPAAGTTGLPFWGSATAAFPKTDATATSPLAGTSVTAVTATLQVSDLSTPAGVQAGTDKPGFSAEAQVRVYVFVTTGAAQAAVAALDRVLYPAVPAAALLVAAVAFLTTRRALRPVEQIRARTDAVNASDPRERVAVPDTGDEIARLAVTINTTLERLDTAARTQRRFVADAAHELRSPLASLLATLEVAEAYPEQADWPGTVATAAGQARRIQALADDLLLLARLDAAPATNDQAVDVAAIAQDVAADTVARRDLVSVLDDTGGRALIEGNPAQIERMLRNLVDNATRYARTRVEISIRADRAEVALTVEDDGPGIPPGDRERVFERFTRLDDDRSRETGGSGLGLAIAREIAERHGGTLRVADGTRGAQFAVRLPLADGARLNANYSVSLT